MEILRGGINGIGRYAQGLGDDEMTPALLDFGTHHPDPRNGEGTDVVAGMDGMIGHAGRGATSEAIHRHIGVFQSRQSDAAVQDRLDLLVSLPRFETEFSHRRAEAPDVILETEEIALPDPYHVIRHIRGAITPVRDG